MNAEIFREWLQRQGHHIIRTKSSFWYDAAPHVYQAFPYGWLIEPTEDELRKLMVHNRIIALRYSAPLESSFGKVSYHVTLRNPYNLEILRSQARNAVKRGLSKCSVEMVPFERVAGEGWNLQQDTLDRQGRLGTMNNKDWERICLSAVGLNGFEAWTAIVGGEMAAGIIVCRIDDTYNVPYAFSHRKHLDLYVNNALFYSVSCNLLERVGIKEIFFTVQSLDAPKSVDDFKFRMGLQAKAVRQRVVFNPMIEPIITRSSTSLFQIYVINIQKHPWPKLRMMRLLRWKLPVDEQEWPECLSVYAGVC
jgi:hypothetical protein